MLNLRPLSALKFILSQITQIYRVELRRSDSVFSPNKFEPQQVISNPVGSSVVRAIDPGLQLVVFSTSNIVEVVKWRDGSHALRFSVSLQTDDLEEMVSCFAKNLIFEEIWTYYFLSVEWNNWHTLSGPLYADLQNSVC